MNKKELISFLKKENKGIINDTITAACKTYDYLKEHKHKLYKDGKQSYMINNHVCFCTHMDFRLGILHFSPLDYTVDIGSGYAGGTLILKF